jgi:hypothetical protein
VKVFKLATGLAIGYVLGSRAGREKYEQIAAAARKAQTHPAVTQAQQKARQLLGAPAPAPAAEPSLDLEPAGAPVPRPPRRQPKSPVTVTDPLA